MRLKSTGFTLAELLIALAILGVIATFTIPKVLNSSTSGQNTAIAKEAASMVSGSFSAYQLNNSVAVTTTTADLTDFMNYVKINTTATIATIGNKVACAAATPCLLLHNGGTLQYTAAQAFTAGADASHYITFNIDPDADGTQPEASLVLYGNGRLSTGESATAESTTAGSAGITLQADDPDYIESWN